MKRTFLVALALAIVAVVAGIAWLRAPRSGGIGPTPAPSSATATPASDSAEVTVSIPGLIAPVTVSTDRWGIPHVTAANRADLYRAWGYVTARDRLWQLEITRRAAQGRAWEWFGNRALRDDGGAQLFELADRARRAWRADSADARARVPLQAFAAGVNAYIDRARRGVAPWPEELRRLRRTPEDWRPEDSYLVVFAQAMVLDFGLPEIGEADDIERLGRDAFAARQRFEDRWVYVTIPDSTGSGARREEVGAMGANGVSRDAHTPARPTAGGIRPVAARGTRASGDDRGTWTRAAHATLGRRPLRLDPDERASNVFAVGAARSASGRPLLANDPHLPLASPSSLYAVHVTVPDTVDAAGVCATGVPSLVSGRNRRCAWGLTTLSADVFDVYEDSLSADGRRFWTGRGWEPVVERPFTMRFRLPGGLTAPLVGQTRRYTRHGPVVVMDKRRRRALSVRWTADDARLSLVELLGVETSRDADELTSRMRSLRVPCFNIVAADVGGDVVYQTIGAVPERRTDPGFGPLRGDGSQEWIGIVPAEAMPRWRAPRSGFVVNANNRPIRGDHPAPWPRYEFAHDRALRIAERIGGDDRMTLDDLRSVQNDVVSRGARRLVPALLAAIAPAEADLAPSATANATVDPRAEREARNRAVRRARARAALDTLRAWDGVARRDRVAPTLFRAWYGALLRRSGFEDTPGLAFAALTGEAPDAWPAGADGAPESPAVATAAALDTALARLTHLLGPDLSRWTWGRAHQASFAHRLAWREPDLALDGVPVDGDNSTPCVGRSRLPWTPAVAHGPAWRMLVDLADTSRALVVLPPGNAGEGVHSRDLLDAWVNHRYATLSLDPADPARRPHRVLELVPADSDVAARSLGQRPGGPAVAPARIGIARGAGHRDEAGIDVANKVAHK